MKKIAHIADLHLRSYEYLDEVRFTLNELIESLKIEKPDIIYLGGDIYHNKLTVTNEYFDICSKMFRDMSNIAPVIVILGNHDLALNNANRLDAITPVLNALGQTTHPVHFLRSSTDSISFPGDNHTLFFHVLSILDEKAKWPNQDTVLNGLQTGAYKEEDIHIALYHGSINGCLLDNDWTSRGNKDDLDVFAGFDFGLLGDIHKFQMLTDRVAYPGSLRQGNFGEDTEKGYLLWQVESKDKFSVDRVILPQKRYFYTIQIDKASDLEKDDKISQGSRVRVVVKDRVGLVEEAEIKDKVKEWYKPCNDVTVSSLFDGSSLQSVSVGDEEFSQDNIRLPDTQRKLIKNFFKNENLTDDQLNEIYDLDKKYNSFIDVSAHRNTIWQLQKLKWSNMFSYGSDNYIDLEKLNGLVGIFGDNGCGKSAIIDSLSYGLFNSINKEGATKNAEYINNRKKKCEVDLKISFNGEEYRINRETSKPVKEGLSPKNEIDFYKKQSGKKISLNGETKPDTNQNIRNIFGTIDDFVATSLCPQEGLIKFIDARGTDKKKIFNKFFDLDFFETKYDLADKDYSAIKSKIKGFGDTNFEEGLTKIANDSLALKLEIENLLNSKINLEKNIDDLNNEILLKTSKLQSSEFSGDIVKISRDFETVQNELKEVEKGLGENFSTQDPDSLEEQKNKLLKSLSELKTKLLDIKKQKEVYFQREESASLLKKIPCGDQYPTCAFIEKAHKANSELKETDVSIFDTIIALEADITTYEKALKINSEEQAKLNKYNSLLLARENLQLKTSKLQEQLDLYDQCKESVIKNEVINKEIAEIKIDKEKLLHDLGSIAEKLSSLYKSIGSLESQHSAIKDKAEEIKALRTKSFYYELYLKAMGKNGISYTIASQKLPIVNEEANRILKHVEDYTVSIEDNEEEKSIKLYLVKGKEKIPVELASGSQKTMISLALRTSLWRITSIPKTPCLILDEPFGFMQEGKHDAIVKMLKYLKIYFKHIFIITHDSNLKNVVDFTIYIETNEEGFAFCKV